MFCKNCGATLSDSARFCKVCGMAVGAAAQQAAPQAPAPAPEQPAPAPQAQVYQQPAPAPQQAAPQQPAPAPEQPAPAPQAPEYQQQPAYTYAQPAPPAKKKLSGKLLAIIAIPVAAVVLILVLTNSAGKGGLFSNPVKDDDSGAVSVHYTYMDKAPTPIVTFTALNELYPSGYRSLDSLVTFAGYCDYGETDVSIEVEVPGFTQQYKQKVHLGNQVTQIRILPPLIPGDLGDLDLASEKMSTLAYSATDMNTGKVLVQESPSIKLYSIYDMVWGNAEHGRAYADNILAWMTPDAPEILDLSRQAIDYMSEITDGKLHGMYGYQDYHYFDTKGGNTWIQAVALQGAMGDKVGIRYNNSLFSMDSQQRVKLPADTINSRSGLCIETSLVMATALQAANMHVMIVLPPGHAQVAVEAWPDTGDYYLIETTRLPMERSNESWASTVKYKDKDAWQSYIEGTSDDVKGPCYVVDCDLGKKLGIRPITN